MPIRPRSYRVAACIAIAGALVLSVSCSPAPDDDTEVGSPSPTPSSSAETTKPVEMSATARPQQTDSLSPDELDQRFIEKVLTCPGFHEIAFVDAYEEFRTLAATEPLDAQTSSAAGDLINDIYLCFVAAARYGIGSPDLEDAFLQVREASLAVINPATPEMVTNFNAALEVWTPIFGNPN
jgi:hypothetical protein